MIAVKGKYKKGVVVLGEQVASLREDQTVIVTVLDDEIVASPGRLNLDDFNFSKAQKVLENYKGSLSDEVIKERRSYV